MKNYIAIVRDHSGSMRGLVKGAVRDYNTNISALKQAAEKQNQDTIVSTVKCGAGSRGVVERDIVNSSVKVLREMSERDYSADGPATPLFDSVDEAISILKSVPDYDDPDVSFLVMVITDGAENSSRISGDKLGEEIRRLNKSDRWTFTFRVPRGYASGLARRLNIPDGNILEWDQTDEGFIRATASTRDAIDNYYTSRSLGKKSLQTFYTDLKNVAPIDLKINCEDISRKVQIWRTSKDDIIRDFVERKLRKNMLKGAAFYELTKTEKNVQDYKMIAIRDRKTGAVYSGPAARQMLGLPTHGDVQLVPGNHDQYDVFIQSTSVNRKLPVGTHVLYYPDVGVPFTEGVSAQWKR